MSKVIDIIKENNKTFYDYRSGANKPIWKRLLSEFLCTILIILVFCRPGDALISGTITVQSILIGFCFSVMFFITSSKDDGGNKKNKKEEKEGIIEDKIKKERIDKLTVELFYNVSYFSIVSIANLAVSLSLLLPNLEVKDGTLQQYLNLSATALYFMFYITIIEAGYSFVRIILRINYFFHQKISAKAS